MDKCQPGRVLYVEGTAPDEDRFAVDIFNYKPWEIVSWEMGNDIALHINPRFNEDPHVIVRNTCTKGQWEEEERGGGMPIRPGENFIVAVTWQQYGFEIAVNGWHFATYKYRHPISEMMIMLLWGLSFVKRMKYI